MKALLIITYYSLFPFLLLPTRDHPKDSNMRMTSKTRFSQYYVVRVRKPASFWQEKCDNCRRWTQVLA